MTFQAYTDDPNLKPVERELRSLCAHLQAGTYRLLVLIRKYDEDKGWAGDGVLSCAHWLNWQCGIGLVAAREKVRVAHALAKLPLISAAFSEGQLSYSKVRAMTRVAMPSNEALLVEYAQHGTAAQIETLTRHYQGQLKREAHEWGERQQAQRSVSWSYDDDGMMVLKAKLPTEEGAQVLAALRLAAEAVKADEGAAEPQRDNESFDKAGLSACAENHECGNAAANELGVFDGKNANLEDPDASAEASSLVEDSDAAATAECHAVTEGVEAHEPPKSASAEAPNAEPKVNAVYDRLTGHIGYQWREDWPTLADRRYADALLLMANTVLSHGVRGVTPAERHLVTVHVDAALLAGVTDGVEAAHETDDTYGDAHGTSPPMIDSPSTDSLAADILATAPLANGLCELSNGRMLMVETARRLGCDASLVGLLRSDSQVLDVGRRTRAIPVGMRRALKARDNGCRFPGCNRRHWLQAHHIHHWAKGGETSLKNLVSLCHFHHKLVHEGGFSIERLDEGALHFIGPHGDWVPATAIIPKPLPGETVETLNEANGLDIDELTGQCLWLGDAPDYGEAVGALMRLDGVDLWQT